MHPTDSLLFEPSHFSVPAPWAGHLPFAHWLTAVHRPATLVELGAYSGISYMAFCQAVMEHRLATRCWAVDTWEGDPHAGFYGEHIYTTLSDQHNPRYGHFSTLLRTTFDDAVQRFEDGSVDLLHIDGLHTYEAVRHDLDTWRPKLSERAVVLFHDSNVFQDDFGVHQLWRELEGQYPSINFLHSNGLGVLLIGPQQPTALLDLCAPDRRETHRQTFAKLGERFEERARRLIQATLLQDAHTLLQREQQAGQQRHEWIEKQDTDITTLRQDLANTQERLTRTVHQLHSSRAEQSRLNTSLASAQADLQSLYNSRSWRLTAPLRMLMRGAAGSRRLAGKLGKGLAYVRRGDIRGLMLRLRAIQRERQHPILDPELQSSRGTLTFGVMTPPHTRFLAEQIAQRLRHHGWEATVLGEQTGPFHADLYVVLGAQTFKRLPPGEKRIVYQLEQSVSSRWFSLDYFKLLNQSLAVLDYNLHNLAFLADHDIRFPHVFYLPVGGSTALLPSDRSPTVDVIFYGDSLSSPRRREMLAELQRHFQVDVVNDLFGPALYERIRRARLVINLHYYENALLETPRLQECLSLGVPVVSESSSNQGEFEQLTPVVRFFEAGNAAAMVQAVRDSLAQLPSLEDLHTCVQATEQHFNFLFDRFLIALNLLGSEQVPRLSLPLAPAQDMVALSLPETVVRRRAFMVERPPGCAVYDGLRKTPGWVGCGLSYQSLAHHALKHQLPMLTVMEDDVVLPPDFEARYAHVKAYLDARPGEWDVFAGLIASLHPDAKVLKVEEVDGVCFVTLDRMISMVFNIYSPRMLQVLARWDARNEDAGSNTIDRFVESQLDLRVVVTLPFFAGHHEDMHSTLWGFQNTQYRDMIGESERALRERVDAFRLTN